MVNCEDIIQFLDTYLNSTQIADASCNGLQVAGTARVGKIVFGVSASLELFRKAKAAGADLIVVHHGLLWGQEQPLTGLFRERVAFLLKHDLNLAAYHLPLDKHPVVGHNACLMRAVQAQRLEPFGEYHGVPIGFSGRVENKPLKELVQSWEKCCQTKAQVLAFGPDKVNSLAVVSGGAYSLLPQAIGKKLDLYVTGVLDEPVQEWCREGHINCVALGHYNSEKPGIKALLDLVAKHFQVETEFIDIENPI
ncbi:MAG: Nif3-like dinuclear metal center hexameric protein [Elusimicrobiaceae bacterium]|nr:Nif3-like dinuclear metal center hexameric protein [Elusimicrobiaceae bacterium]